MKAAQPVMDSKGQAVELSRIMQNRHYTPTMKAEVVRGILAGLIVTWQGSRTGMASLQVKTDSFQDWIGHTSNRQLAHSRTPLEAASELQCDRGCISSLLKMGHLLGGSTYSGFKIEGQSITAFKAEYVSLVSCAKRRGTSTRALMARCDQAGIDLLLVPLKRRAGPQPFIRVLDAEHLMAAA
jgi:hypothetical protein